MTDIEPVIARELELLSPDDDLREPDWNGVLRRTSRIETPQRARLDPRAMRHRTLALAAAAVALIAAGAAVAGIVLAKTAAEEAQGLLDGHSVFAGTTPVCTMVAERHFRCVLGRPPTGQGTTIEGSYRGSKFQTVDADKRIDGGCIGASDDGLIWNCYLGDLAVEHEILSSDLLGQVQTEPGRG